MEDATPNLSFGIQNMIIPSAGPKVAFATLNFSGTAGYEIDCSQLVESGKIENIQTIFVDNASNPNDLIILTNITPQRIIVSAGSQGYYSILQPNPPKLQLLTPQGNYNVIIGLLNVPVQPAEWGGSPLGAATGGVDVADNIPFPISTALLCDSDMVATVTFANGAVVGGVPLQKGYNPIRCTNIGFAGGTIVALTN